MCVARMNGAMRVASPVSNLEPGGHSNALLLALLGLPVLERFVAFLDARDGYRRLRHAEVGVETAGDCLGRFEEQCVVVLLACRGSVEVALQCGKRLICGACGPGFSASWWPKSSGQYDSRHLTIRSAANRFQVQYIAAPSIRLLVFVPRRCLEQAAAHSAEAPRSHALSPFLLDSEDKVFSRGR